MRLSLSPWARERLGAEAIAALRAAPDNFQLAVSRGRSGWGATLTHRAPGGYELLADVRGYPDPESVITAVMEVARPKPRLVDA